MDYLQYIRLKDKFHSLFFEVLNLVINGLPSILHYPNVPDDESLQ